MRVRAFAIRLLLGAGVVLSSGCATVRQQAVVEQMYEYAYARPLDEVWPEVRRFVAEEGYPPLESPGQYVVISDWVTSFGENRIASSAERIFVRGVPLNRANSEVRIFRQTRMLGNKGQPSYRERNNGSSLMVLTADEASPLDGSGGSGFRLGAPRTQNRVFTRAVDLEWKLLRRLDPEDARRLEELAARGEPAPTLNESSP
jgi:hypothetical protein